MLSRLAQGSNSAGLLQDLQELSREVRLLQENYHSRNVSYNISDEVRDSPFQYERPVQHTGQACQPRYAIDKDLITRLRNESFKWVDMARILKISSKTLIRRHKEY